MVVDPVVYHADSSREISRAYRIVRIVKEQRVIHSRQSSPLHCPVDDVIMLLQRSHIIYILRIILASYRCLHACELVILLYHVPDVAAIIDPANSP